jgi:hypothetical protein
MQMDGPGVYNIGNVRLVGIVLYGLHNVDGGPRGICHYWVLGTLVTPFEVPLRLYYLYRSKGLRGGFKEVRPMFLWYFPNI